MELHHKPDQACLMLPMFPGSPVFYESLDLEASDDLLAVKNHLIHDNRGKVVMSWVIFLVSRIIIYLFTNLLYHHQQFLSSYLQ